MILIYITYLVKLEVFCQGILILMCFWSQFRRKIGWFKILEIVTNPERRRRAVSPACPPKLYATVGATSKGRRVTRVQSGPSLVYILNTNEFMGVQNVRLLAIL